MKLLKALFVALCLALAVCLLASCGGDPGTGGGGGGNEKDFTVTFVVGDKTTAVGYNIGETPSFTGKTPRGQVIAGWDKPFTSVLGDATYTAILTNEGRVTKEVLYDAYKAGLIQQDFNPEFLAGDTSVYPISNNNASCMINNAGAAFTLALEEYENPQEGPVRDRVIEHLKSITFDGNAPTLDLLPIWSTPALTSLIAIAKLTPSVWDILPDGMEERLDCIMKAFCCLVSMGNADWNDFWTGPGLTGNYKRNWNVNYALSNVLPIVNATIYFGTEDYDYDVEKGAKAVNDIIKAFDYDTYVAKFQEYGFTAPYALWTRDQGTDIEGTIKTLMMDGTERGMKLLVASNPTNGDSNVGEGVRPKDGTSDFSWTYDGHSYKLTDLVGIFNALSAYCFSGGIIASGPTEVKNAWTIKDPEENPMIGLPGMFAELNQGTSRSSAGYARDDFGQYAFEVAFLSAIGLYDREVNASMLETAGNGMNDLMYKFLKGYHSYASSSNATGSDDYESAYGGYYYARALWMIYMGDDRMAEYFPESLLPN